MHFHEIDIVEQYSKFIVLYKRFIDDIFSIRESPGIPTQNFWMLLIKKNDRIKLVHCISDRSISFLDLCLYRDYSSSVLQFSTF